MKYNVFISSKSEDYSYAEQVYNFLKQNGLKVFLACRELDRLGEAQYAIAIDEALDNTTHMIVVGSSIGYINSKWVKYEWSIFSNDLKSGYRNGNLINVLSKDLQLKNLPPSLRHNQSFTFENYKQHILSYLNEDDNELAAKLEAARLEISHLRSSLTDMTDKVDVLKKKLQEEKRVSQERLDTIKALSKRLSEYEHLSTKSKNEYIIRIVDSFLLVSQSTHILNKFGIKPSKEQLNLLLHRDPCDFGIDTFSNAVKAKKDLEGIGVKVIIKEINK